MKTVIIALFAAASAQAAQLTWNPNPENSIVNYKVWSEENGNYILLGTTTKPSFDLGPVTAQKKVCVSATAWNNIDGAKSEVMVINPDEPAPYAYVSLHGSRTYTFAVNAGAAQRFFRFDIVGNQATLQSSVGLQDWQAITSVFVAGGGLDAPRISFSKR